MSGSRAPARLLAAAALLAVPVAGAEEPTRSVSPPDFTSGFAIGPSARVLFLTLDGSAYADRDATFGTDLDLVSDLGMDNTATGVELGVVAGWWDAWSPTLNFRYGFEAKGMWGGFTDRETLGTDTVYNGRSFPAGTSVRSHFDFDLTQIHGTAGWRFGSEDRWTADVKLFLGVSVLGASLELDPSGGTSEEEGLRLVPFGGGIQAAFAPCRWFDIGGSAAYYGTYIRFDSWDYDEYLETSELVDLSLHVSFRPIQHAAVEVGYRYLDASLFMEWIDRDYPYTLKRRKTEFDWTLQGWYVGATISF